MQSVTDHTAEPLERLQRAGQRFGPASRQQFEQALAAFATAGVPGEEHLRVAAVIDLMTVLGLDHECAVAELMLPLLRSGAIDAEGLRRQFGAKIVELAEGVQRMDQIGVLPAQERETQTGRSSHLEPLRKMLLAMAQDVRVVLIKLAEHLIQLRSGLRSASGADPGLRQLALLTREVFAPLANRLGVWQVKWELEDLALRILDPDTYRGIARLLDEKRRDREHYIDHVVSLLRAELARSGISAEISGRPKHIASIHRKMQSKGLDFEGLYDVRAVRVIVGDIRECYAVLGLVHALWTPLPKEFDDYIAKPKANQYRSLHTAVIGPGGKSLEVQIRTREMHEHAERGVAAHWQYKEGGTREGGTREGGIQERGYREKIAWLRQVLEWKDEISDEVDLAEQLRSGLFDDAVYVLTPQGRVIDLPAGATPVDFAYHVHTELGHRCRGARVDGLMVPLNTPLANGQQVEILAAKQGGPSRDWLNPQLGFLKSAGARAKVRQWFNRLNLEADVAQGRALLERELQRLGKSRTNLEQLAARLEFERLPDFLAALARGEVGPKSVQEALSGEPQAPAVAPIVARKPKTAGGGVLVVGVDKLLTATARCCRPAPPEPIAGFVTRGRGVSVHRADCAALARLDPARRIAAEWGQLGSATFPVEVVVDAADRTGLLRDISEVLSRERINVTATRTRSTDLSARMRFTLEVADLTQLHRVLILIRGVRGVSSAERC